MKELKKNFDYIDLHYVPPQLVKEVLEDFLKNSYENGIKSVKIITGKGIGVYRKISIEICKKIGFVKKINIAQPWESGEGAIYVYFIENNK